MEHLKEFIDLFLHLDKHLTQIINDYGTMTYLILFLIIFIETGLVVMPFLPGDSLLFVAGTLAANEANHLSLGLLMCVLLVAAVLGDAVNFHIGQFFGPRVFSRDYKLLKREHILKTQGFYEKHGGKTIILARFIPIIRTFAPFVAGIGKMNYGKFLTYNLAGGLVWVIGFLTAGYLLGSNEWVKHNFELVALGIVFLSILPPIVEFAKSKLGKKEPEVLA